MRTTQRAGRTPRLVGPASPISGPAAAHPLLTLQTLVGNRATTALIQRKKGRNPVSSPPKRGARPAAAKPPVVTRTAAEVATLQKDILATIEHMELASAKDGGKPAVTESAYHTSSGIRASYASRMQATIPWTTELLERHADLRTKFGVTIEDLGKAKGVMVHVTALWNRLMGLPGTPTLDIARSDAKVAAHLPGSGLDDDDLARMLAFAGWRQTVEAGLPHMATKQAELAALDLDHLVGLATALELAKALKPANRRAARAWKKDKKKGAVPPAVPADLTSTERKSLEELIARRLVVAPLEKAGVDAGVGIDAASAHRYVAQEKAHEEKATTSAHWGEDLAAWRRFAVEKTFPEIAAKIAQAATDDEGMTLGHAQVADDVGALGHAHPDWNDNDLAWQAFKRQNGDNKYADDALSFFKQVHAMPSP